MNKEQANKIQIGDMLKQKGWNQSEKSRKLAERTQVLDVQKGQRSQTGVLLKVKFLSGETTYLDAGWFYPDPRY